ncbi:glycoside hydrolase family 3 protein, partial [candidate division KSB1 bacterium]
MRRPFHYLFKIGVITGVLCLSHIAIFGQNNSNVPLYLDSDASIEKRVEDLLSRMTLEEKIGQLNVPRPRMVKLEHDSEFEGCVHFVKGTLLNNIGPGGGIKSIRDNVRNEVEFINKLQKVAVEDTRLKIPLLNIEEGEHGVMTTGCTVFPLGASIGSTWNIDLISDIYEAVAREARALGVHMICIVGMEPNRDPRLGRNEHGWSEDPYMCSILSETVVKAVQGYDLSSNDKAITLLSHFPGQSQPVAGLERGAMEISERMLREVFLPPWISAITKAGGLAVMATYPAIDGIPAHASKELMLDLLCGELGFKGVVTS